MNPSPSISVIIPAYNSSKTILRALDSVLSQSVTPHEVIVVDDGSVDNTRAIVESTYPLVKLIQQKNAGAAAARNTGVKNSSGDLIAFLDSDDFWHKRKLEYQISIFKQFPEVGISSTGCRFITEAPDLNYIEKSQLALDAIGYRKVDFKEVFNTPYFGTPSVMMKRGLFEQVNGFDEALETAEDVDLWIRATYQSHYLLILNPLTYVVGQEESLSTRASVSPYASHINVMDRFVQKNKLSFYFNNVIYRKTKSEVYCDWGSSLLVNKENSKAGKKLLKSIVIFPNLRAIYLFIKTIVT